MEPFGGLTAQDYVRAAAEEAERLGVGYCWLPGVEARQHPYSPITGNMFCGRCPDLGKVPDCAGACDIAQHCWRPERLRVLEKCKCPCARPPTPERIEAFTLWLARRMRECRVEGWYALRVSKG